VKIDSLGTENWLSLMRPRGIASFRLLDREWGKGTATTAPARRRQCAVRASDQRHEALELGCAAVPGPERLSGPQSEWGAVAPSLRGGAAGLGGSGMRHGWQLGRFV